MGTPEMWTFLAGIVASAFALARMTLHQNRSLMDRLIDFLDEVTRRQEERLTRIVGLVEEVKLTVHENNALLRRLEEPSVMTFGEDERTCRSQ